MRNTLLGLMAGLFAVLAVAPAFAADAPVALPSTPAAEHFRAWLEAFNQGDVAGLSAMMTKHFSAEALKARSADARAQRMAGMRKDFGPLTVLKVVETTPTHLRLLARQGAEQLVDVNLDCEAQTPFAVTGVRLEMVDSADEVKPVTAMTEPEILAAIDRELAERARTDRFSGAVLVAKNGAPLLRKAYGAADRRFAVANRPDTRFNLGSINKNFTKAAIAQLAEQGKLKLDDSIDRYLPDYPKAVATKVTIDMLITMRSGIGDIFGPAFDAMDRSKLRTIQDYIPLFRDQPLWFEPGTDQRYSNGSYVLLGAIIEKVSGESYYDYVRAHLFVPAGMTRTDSYAVDEIVENLATGYTREGEANAPLRSNVYRLPARGSSAGGGYSTLDDMLAYVTALRAGKLMSAPYASWVLGGPRPERGGTASTTAAAMSAGLSWGIAGGSAGVNATLELEGPYVLVVLSNLDPPSAEQPSGAFRRMLANVKH